MSKKKLEKEASVAANAKGFQAPFSADPAKAKGKEKKDKNNLYSQEKKKFESKVVKELIKKIGDQWAIIDPKTGAEVAKAPTRDHAREMQRNLGISHTRDRKDGSKPGQDKEKTSKATKPSFSNESLKSFLKKALKESGMKLVPLNESVFSYAFEHTPISESEMVWENFLNKLSNEIVWSDSKLKEMIAKQRHAEGKTLEKSLACIKNVLEGTGSFKVVPGKMVKTKEGNIIKNFEVLMAGCGAKLPFGVKFENKKPLILFPEDSRRAINNMANEESKLLRAELMHVQETALDLMDDIIKIGKKRDGYLNNVQKNLHKMLDNFSLLELAMLKNIMKGR